MLKSAKYTTRYETWTIADLIDATSPQPRRNRKVTIPIFQRRLVWSRKKQRELIQSIKKGYPFGSLLLYKDPDTSGTVETFKLIDGLQRTATLRQYTNSPNTAFSKEKLPDRFIDFIAQKLNPFSEVDCLTKSNKNKIQRLLLEWVWESRGFNKNDG